ncbi:hypothetical protein RRG08_007449, partial [Elysia crispata]
ASLDFTLNRETPTDAGSRNVCGVLICKELIKLSDSSTSDTDQASSGFAIGSIASLSVFKRVSSGSKNDTHGQRKELIASVTSQVRLVRSVANGRKIDGLLEPERATLRIELVKQDDCQAEFVCHVRGLDTLSREVMRSASLIQQLDQNRNQVYDRSLMPAMSLQLLTSLQQLITQSASELEKKFEDKIGHLEETIGQLLKYLEDRSISFERRLDDKLSSFENRIEDKIDNNNNLNKLIQLDSKVSSELEQFRTEAKADILGSLDTMRQRYEREQKEALKNVSESFDRTLNDTAGLLSSMGSELDLLKTYGQMNLVILRNESEAIREMLTSRVVSAPCLRNDTTTKTENIPNPIPFFRRVACERGMNGGVNGKYPEYIITTQFTIQREILCDTQTDGGGWTVIQRRIKGDVSFFRDWESYKNGFGKPDSGGDFWLGNEAVHILTYMKPHELRVEIRHEGRDYFAQYKTFNLGSEANKYRIRLGDVSGSIDDGSGNTGLSYSNGMYFSTFDRENESYKALKCAMTYKAGWWFKTCYRSLLNAPLTDGKNGWHNGKKWMKATLTAMKIRPL